MILLHFPTCWNCRYVPACLAAQHLCSPLKMLGFCSGMQLNYLEIVWVFWMLLIRFVAWDKTVRSNQAHYSLPVSQDTYVFIPSKLKHEALQSGWWEWIHIPSAGHCSLLHFLCSWMASLDVCPIRTLELSPPDLEFLTLFSEPYL